MKCSSCNKENSPGAKFCKYCGSPISTSMKTCKNGHNYDSSLNDCPYCQPRTIEYKDSTKNDSSGSSNLERTILDDEKSRDKTVIDFSAPTLAVGNVNTSQSDKTTIFNPNENSQENVNSQMKQVQGIRKLVGWLVTYDIDPNGKDFRIYEGKNKIGSNNISNDIVIREEGISRDHAIILYRQGKFIIQDQLSNNGTFVNKKMIEDRLEIKNDDEISIGKINCKLKII